MTSRRHLVLCVPNMARRPENTNRLFTLATLHLRATAEGAGWRCSIVDAYFDDLGLEQTMDRVRGCGAADAIGFTINAAPMLETARQLVDLLPEIPSAILGGFEASARADAIAAEDARFAAVVRGEGEQTLRDVLDWLAEQRPSRAIPGACIRTRDGEILNGGRRAPMADLDAPLALEALPASLRPGEHSIVTSRGCSARCNYCVIGPHWSKYGQWRGHTAQWVADQIEARARLGATHINLVDDQFIGPPASIARAAELAEILHRRGLRVPFVFMCRADTVCENPSLLEALREVGLSNVFLGLESGNAPVLRTLRKDATLRDAVRAVAILDRLGVGIAAGTIIFHPWSTPRTLRRDIAFFGELLARHQHFHFYGLNELDVFHSTPLGARLGLRDPGSWRQGWQFQDGLAAAIHGTWSHVSSRVLHPLISAAEPARRLPVRQAINRFQLDTLEDVIAACETSAPRLDVVQRARVRGCQMLLRHVGAASVRRFLLGADAPEGVVNERCFD